ncbi:hypothetical protein P3342_005734 [Pyrenophora teres f. teres]|nr:hypothetical protein P3342_005734 [Pyrenophora teres f. teres]
MEREVTVKDAAKAQVVTDPETDKADAGDPQRTIALDDGCSSDAWNGIMKGPVCEVTESRETKCGAMVLGSYISFLLAKDLYSVRRAATETSLSIQEACDASKEVDIAISGATSKHSNSVYVHRGCFKGYDFEDLSNENPDSVGITYATHERTSKESRIDPR